MTSISYCRSKIAPYLVTTGSSDTSILNHDVRVKDSVISTINRHKGQISSVLWSGYNSRDMMQMTDPSQVLLASSSVEDSALATWSLRDILNHSHGAELNPRTFCSLDKGASKLVLAWHPHKTGFLATGGGGADENIIRLWNFNKGTAPVHAVRCTAPVTALSWRKSLLSNPESDDLISTHGYPENGFKLWQVDKVRSDGGPTESSFKYWFTKAKDFGCHEAAICSQVLSPDGSLSATLSHDETLALWKVFTPLQKNKDTFN